MKIKKIFIITLFLLSLLMIGAVSAANNDPVVSSDVNDDTVVGIQDNSGERAMGHCFNASGYENS